MKIENACLYDIDSGKYHRINDITSIEMEEVIPTEEMELGKQLLEDIKRVREMELTVKPTEETKRIFYMIDRQISLRNAIKNCEMYLDRIHKFYKGHNMNVYVSTIFSGDPIRVLDLEKLLNGLIYCMNEELKLIGG